MDNITVFKNPQFGEVRTVQVNGEPWFVAADVCRALDLGNPSQALARLDDDERDITLISNEDKRIRGNPVMAVVNEPGLYSLVLGSRKPEAKAFKRWITHDVLPTIRKTGGYVDSEERFIQTYLPGVDESVKALFSATLTELRKSNAKLEAAKPKVLFAEAVEASSTSILVGELAKLIKQNGVDIGQNRLFAWLRKNGYLTQGNEPTQRSMERKLFEVTERTVNNPDGSIRITRTTKVTGKGQTYFINKFLADRE